MATAMTGRSWHEAETYLQRKPRAIRQMQSPLSCAVSLGKARQLGGRVVATRAAVICSACPIMIVGHGSADEKARILDP